MSERAASPQLRTLLSMIQIAALVANHTEPQFGTGSSVDDRVGEPGEWVYPPFSACRCAEIGKLVEKSCDPLELSQEPFGHADTGFALVEAESFRQIVIRARVDRQLHSSSALRRARASATAMLCT